jgi:hypothetical protein
MFSRVFIAFILSIQISCAQIKELNEKRDKADADLTVICDKLPIPENFSTGKSEKTRDIKKVAIFRRFKSNESCKSAGEHFRNHFIDQGWNKDQMKVTQMWGGMGVLDYEFRKDEYVVSIECEHPTASDDANKEIVISCSWGLIP